MTEKPTFVDMVQEATRQRHRRARERDIKPADKDEPKIGRWPSPRQKQWRLALLKPWKSN